MRKLRLAVGDLAVESFSIPSEGEAGTVRAHSGENTLFGMGNTCDGTCYAFCVENGGSVQCGSYATQMTHCDQRASCLPRNTCAMSCMDWITECGASCNADCSMPCPITIPGC